jgi:restriction endonuclease S subunit
MRQTSLQQYASVFSGYTFRKSLTSNSDTIGVIQSRDTNVPAQEINYSGWASSPDFSGSDKYLLQDRDILLLSKGGNNSAFLFEKNKCTFPDAVAAGAFIVIRVMPAHLDAAYLAYFLNLPKTQAIFKSLQVGTTVQNLSIKHVQEVGIKMPPLPKQKTLGEVYSLGRAYMKSENERLTLYQQLLDQTLEGLL